MNNIEEMEAAEARMKLRRETFIAPDVSKLSVARSSQLEAYVSSAV